VKYYKILLDNHSCVAGNFDWTPYLPKDGRPGLWTPKIVGKLELCEKGYHLTDAAHLLTWCQGNQLFEAEAKWKILVGDDKVACRQVRLLRQVESWNEKNLRLFACWCVRQIWHLLTDERSRNAVTVAEKYANGEATQEELAAAGDAARAAALDAAGDAAMAAALDAAWDAARAAGWARAAAWNAARAAALDAAWDAAREAAGDAARAAAWDAQSKHLIEMLGLEE
jgi:hypothetical protein